MKIRFLVFLMILSVVRPVQASDYKGEEIKLQKIRCTCYTSQEFTATGIIPYQGLAAYRPEDIGKTAYLYEIADDGSIGSFIGQYEILDTGGPNVKKGYVFDVWRQNLEDCEAFSDEHGDYVYIRIEDEL